jgi:hypothetical protein
LVGRIRRHFSVGGYFDVAAVEALCGFAQGDALSLLWAAVALAVWASFVSDEGGEAQAYVDDRYIITRSQLTLQRIVQETIIHDGIAGLKLNKEKCAATASSVGARRSLKRLKVGRNCIKVATGFKAIGHSISGASKVNLKLCKHRLRLGMATNRRVKSSKILSRHQKSLGVCRVAMPQAGFGNWLTGVTSMAAKGFTTTASRILWGSGGKSRAKELLLSLVLPGHAVCPAEAADYSTVMTTARVLRRNTDLRDRVSIMINHLSRTENECSYDGNFPVRRLQKSLALSTCRLTVTFASSTRTDLSCAPGKRATPFWDITCVTGCECGTGGI